MVPGATVETIRARRENRRQKMNHDHSKIELKPGTDQISAWCATNGQARDGAPTPEACPAYGRFLLWKKLYPWDSYRRLASLANNWIGTPEQYAKAKGEHAGAVARDDARARHQDNE